MSKPATHLAEGDPDGIPAAGYVRRSTDMQEQSLGDQQREIAVHAARKGFRIVRWFEDDAISGTSVAGRDGFREMLEAALGPKRDWSVLFVYDISRFSRGDLAEAGHFRHQLQKAGVTIEFCTENFTGGDEDELVWGVKQWLARKFVKDLSRVTIRGHVSTIQAGAYIGGVAPYGYDFLYLDSRGEPVMLFRYRTNGDREMLKPDGELIRLIPQGERWRANRQDRIQLVHSLPERVEVIQRIFRMYLEGHGYKPIASRLNAEGIQSPRCGQWGGTFYDGRWGASTIHNIIVNQTYCGDTLWNRRTQGKFHRVSAGQAVVRDRSASGTSRPNAKEDWIIIPNTHEPIVSREVFAEAARMRDEKETTRHCRHLLMGRGRTSNFLLAGLIRCALCGNKFHGYSQKYRAKTNLQPHERPQSYVCGGYITKGVAVCQRNAIEKAPFEGFVLEQVHKRLLEVLEGGGRELLLGYVAEELDQAASEPGNELASAREELAALKAEADRLLRNLTDANREFIDERLVEIKRRRIEVESRVVALEGASTRQIDPEAAVDAALGRLERFRQVLEAGTFIEQKEFLRCFVIGIDLDPKAKHGTLHMHNMLAASFLTTGWSRPKLYRRMRRFGIPSGFGRP